jgi:hypothetical protein
MEGKHENRPKGQTEGTAGSKARHHRSHALHIDKAAARIGKTMAKREAARKKATPKKGVPKKAA